MHATAGAAAVRRSPLTPLHEPLGARAALCYWEGEPMSVTSVLPDYRALVEEQWRQQLADIVELSDDTHALTTGQPDDGTLATNLNVATRLLVALRQQLEETEAALLRIEDGTYGVCATCRETISPERLEILPAARYCVACLARQRTAR